MIDPSVSRAEFEGLRARVERLEAALAASGTTGEPTGPDDRTVRIVAAAIAAYLGKRATIKVVRRASDDGNAWRAFGRARLVADLVPPSRRGL